LFISHECGVLAEIEIHIEFDECTIVMRFIHGPDGNSDVLLNTNLGSRVENHNSSMTTAIFFGKLDRILSVSTIHVCLQRVFNKRNTFHISWYYRRPVEYAFMRPFSDRELCTDFCFDNDWFRTSHIVNVENFSMRLYQVFTLTTADVKVLDLLSKCTFWHRRWAFGHLHSDVNFICSTVYVIENDILCAVFGEVFSLEHYFVVASHEGYVIRINNPVNAHVLIIFRNRFVLPHEAHIILFLTHDQNLLLIGHEFDG
jgi:hypothetical protein